MVIKINDNYELILNYPTIDYLSWGNIKNCKSDNDIIKVLNSYLKDLDCNKKLNGKFITKTNSFIYKDYLSFYYYYLVKLKNQILYNNYLNKLIDLHLNNINIEQTLTSIDYYNNKKVKKTKSKMPPNKFFKAETKDLFTGESQYIYTNFNTKEEIISSNPNLLDKLNNKNKNNKKEKGVSMSLITFNFKIK